MSYKLNIKYKEFYPIELENNNYKSLADHLTSKFGIERSLQRVVYQGKKYEMDKEEDDTTLPFPNLSKIQFLPSATPEIKDKIVNEEGQKFRIKNDLSSKVPVEKRYGVKKRTADAKHSEFCFVETNELKGKPPF